MGLETGTRIDDLDSDWPLGGDGLGQSDNHHRLIKACVQGSFPSLGSTAVATTGSELNMLDGIDTAADPVEDRLTDLETAASAISGTTVNLGFRFDTGFWTVTLADVTIPMSVTGGPANSLVSWYSSASGSSGYFDSGKLKLDENGNGAWTSAGGNLYGNLSDGGYFTQTVRVHDDTGGRDTDGSPLTTGYYNFLSQRKL